MFALHRTVVVLAVSGLSLSLAGGHARPGEGAGRGSEPEAGAAAETRPLEAPRVPPRAATPLEIDDLPVALRGAVLQASQEQGGEAYRVRPGAGPGAWVATNPGHEFTARFDAAGVTVRPRVAAPPLRLLLTQVSTHEEAQGLTLDAWTADNGRIARRVRAAGVVLTEWYLNGPLGLEQGFTIETASSGSTSPAPSADGAALAGALRNHVELRLAVGGWTGQVVGEGLDLSPDGGNGTEGVLRYDGLAAWDATGRPLPASLQFRDAAIVLDVSVADAVYPVTIDPLLQQAKLVSSPGAARDHFGNSVALSADTALVGAPGTTGSAFVFVRSGGVWTQQAQLVAGEPLAGGFGVSVALSGDTALVGADWGGVGPNQGQAYVFVRSGGVWTQQAKLVASDAAADDRFGWSVALSGETALVGAPYDTVGSSAEQGSAYVFVRNGGVWTQQAHLFASDGAAGDRYGFSVALSGETALVGAGRDDVGAYSDQGSAYVFVRSGAAWTQQAKLVASDGAAGDWFGSRVALSGETALIGAGFDDIGFNAEQGSAYVFVRNGTVWGQQAKLVANDGAASDYFGWSVALSGDIAVVGAPYAQVGLNADQGAAYVFVRSGTTWTRQDKLAAGDGAAGDLFGMSAAPSGDTVLVGAPFARVGSNQEQGSAYVFTSPAVCGYSLSPPSATVAAGGGAGTVGVVITTGSNCGWTATSNASWIAVTGGTSGTGTGTVTYTVGANTGGARSGTLTIAGQAFTVMQAGRFTPPADFDGDSRSDVTVFRPSTGTWYQLRSAGAAHGTAWGVSGDVPVPGDYDGDGKTDPAVYRPSTGTWYLLTSGTGSGLGVTWGLASDLPVPADYDGDGRTDVAVFRPSAGVWYIIRSGTNLAVAVPWGTKGDVPVAADYDGDGKADPTVFRPSTGTWYQLRSTTGIGYGVTWGRSGDVPLAGDFDGDGKADPTVFRASTGQWYELRSSTGVGYGVTWGQNGDIPLTGDYDGDGRADPAVFRASTGTWYELRSSTGAGHGVVWGLAGDLPLMSAGRKTDIFGFTLPAGSSGSVGLGPVQARVGPMEVGLDYSGQFIVLACVGPAGWCRVFGGIPMAVGYVIPDDLPAGAIYVQVYFNPNRVQPPGDATGTVSFTYYAY